MTVKELIMKLMECPLDVEVKVEVNEDKEYGEIDVAEIGGYSGRTLRVLLRIEGVEVTHEQ